MKRSQRAVILSNLADRLRECGSWCGETHLQKATYFLQELLAVPLEFDFIFYKHGPFSFDLRDELTAMCADGLIKFQPQAPPYGPRIITTDDSRTLRQHFPKTLERYKRKVDFAADRLGTKDVVELEGLATALYVSKLNGSPAPLEDRVRELCALKAHIPTERAAAFVENVDEIISAAQDL